jgi:hypothetical protein
MNASIVISGKIDVIGVLIDDIRSSELNVFFDKYQKNDQSFFDDGKTCLGNHNLSERSGITSISISPDKQSIRLDYSSYIENNDLCSNFLYTLSAAFPELLIECKFYSGKLIRMGFIALKNCEIVSFYCFNGPADVNKLLIEFLLSTKFYMSKNTECLSNLFLCISRESRAIHNTIAGSFMEDIYRVNFIDKMVLYWIIDYDQVIDTKIGIQDPIVNEHGIFDIVESSSWIERYGAITEYGFNELFTENASEVALSMVHKDFAQEVYFRD